LYAIAGRFTSPPDVIAYNAVLILGRWTCALNAIANTMPGFSALLQRPDARTGLLNASLLNPVLVRALAIVLALLALLAAADVSAQEWRYRVRPGDNVWELARRHLKPDVPWERLQALNQVEDPYRLVPGSVMRFPLAWLHQQPAKARVVAFAGNIQATRPGSATPFPISVDQSLDAGTTLRTAADASLTLEFADGSRLQLMGDSELQLDRLSAYGSTGMVDTRLRLPRGRTSYDVKPNRGPGSRFIVESPGLMTSVRGTGFRVASDGTRSHSEVYKGNVDVSGGGRRVVVAAGRGTYNDARQQPVTPVALLPAPDLRGLPGDIVRMPESLSWTPVPGAAAYRLQASSHEDFRTLLQDVRSDEPRAQLDLRAEGQAFVRVRAIDAQGLEGLDAVHPVLIAAQPGPPFTISPAIDAKVAGPRPRLRWTLSEGAARYRVQIATTADFAAPVFERDDLKGPDLRPAVDLAPGPYYWRIGSVDAAGKHGPFSDSIGFEVHAADAGPDVSANTAAKGLDVSWRAGDDDQRYRFELSRKADFSVLSEDRLLDDNRIHLPDIKSGTWHMRVSVVESDGYAQAAGPVQTLRVGCGACRILLGVGAVLVLTVL
jgi:hypothetical protein